MKMNERSAGPIIQEVGFDMFCTIKANHARMFKGLFVCRDPSGMSFWAIDKRGYAGLCSWHESKAEAGDWLRWPEDRYLDVKADTTTSPPEKALTSKEFLNQYRDALHDERHIREQIEDLKDQAASTGSRIGGTPVQGGGGSPGRLGLMDNAVDMEMNELRQALAFSRETKRLVKSTIKAVEDSRYRELLMHRYVGLKGWGWIATRMKYSPDYVKGKLHGEALQAINLSEREHKRTQKDT